MKTRELARLVEGELLGEEEVEITGPAGLDSASFNQLTFYAGKDPGTIRDIGAGCIITSVRPDRFKAKALIVAENARLAWARALAAFPLPGEETSPELVFVSPGARIHPTAVLLPFTYVGPGVVIGADSRLGPNVTIHARTAIGKRVYIGAGSVIGSRGFGYVTGPQGNHVRIPHLGKVVIADEVEVGAGCTIDRGTVAETRIGKGTKIDNLVHIAHNVLIGEGCLIAAQSGIAGSAVLEDRVMLAGQVGIRDHVRVGRGTVVLAKSAVFKDVPPGAVVSGVPARPHRLALKAQARLFRDAKNH